MSGDRSSVSCGESYQEIGEFWSDHDLAEFWDQTEPAEFDVDIGSEKRYYAIDRQLSTEVLKVAQERGVSTETLVNLWVREKLAE